MLPLISSRQYERDRTASALREEQPEQKQRHQERHGEVAGNDKSPRPEQHDCYFPDVLP
jgi:hypothetical protein